MVRHIKEVVMTFKISVPIPPSINHCYFYKGNIKIKTPKAREYWAFVERSVREEIVAQNFNRFDSGRKIVCELMYYFPDNRRRDTHNTLKILLDAIEDADLFVDDRYVLPRILDWEIDREHPRVDIVFYYLDTPESAQI